MQNSTSWNIAVNTYLKSERVFWNNKIVLKIKIKKWKVTLTYLEVERYSLREFCTKYCRQMHKLKDHRFFINWLRTENWKIRKTLKIYILSGQLSAFPSVPIPILNDFLQNSLVLNLSADHDHQVTRGIIFWR